MVTSRTGHPFDPAGDVTEVEGQHVTVAANGLLICLFSSISYPLVTGKWRWCYMLVVGRIRTRLGVSKLY